MLDFGDLQANPDKAAPAPVIGPARFKPVRRDQNELRVFALEALIEADHPARTIWEFLEQVDFSAFEAGCKAYEGRAGQSALQPRLLAALWIMACAEGVGSAREVARLCQYHPGYRWLCGDDPVNHHTLSDFRVEHERALRELFVQVLAVLSCQGLVTLKRVMHDGTKIRAAASPASYHREQTLERCLSEAKEQVEALGEPGQDQNRVEAAQRRAAAERKKRLEEARAQLQQLQAKETRTAERENVRVSLTEPEARVIKHPDKTFAPGYNAQLTTEESNGIIVNVALSSNGSDYPHLVPALEQVEENFGKLPDQVVADGGYISRENIIALDGRTDLIGPSMGAEHSEAQRKRNGIDEQFAASVFVFDAASNRFVCPQGATLKHVRAKPGSGKTEHYYRAEASQCRDCAEKQRCCPKSKCRSVLRIEEDAAVKRYRSKVEQPEVKAIYKRRARVAEFPNCWIKQQLKLRRFHVFGRVKAECEMLWHVITYNILQWARVRQPQEAAV